MLEIRNLSAGYPGAPVLENISLDIPQGAVTVIAGPNGSGKSTLLKALAGILPATGSAVLEGQELLTLSGQELARQVAFLPQNRQIPEITARKLVLHGRFPYLSYPRRYRREDEKIADEAMAQMGIPDMKLPILFAMAYPERLPHQWRSRPDPSSRAPDDCSHGRRAFPRS